VAAEEEKKREEEDKALKGIGLKDYIAMTIAALTTFLLPLVILMVVLGALALVLALRL